MFEYSLENGKKQFKEGFIFLIVTVVLLVLFFILSRVVKTSGGLLAVIIIFSIALGAFGLLSLIKIIFGAVVYHAERTQSKSISELKKQNEQEWSKVQDKLSKYKEVIFNDKEPVQSKNEKTIKIDNLDKTNQVPVVKWYYKDGVLTVYLVNAHVYNVEIDDKLLQSWKSLDWIDKTKIFYEDLFKSAVPHHE